MWDTAAGSLEPSRDAQWKVLEKSVGASPGCPKARNTQAEGVVVRGTKLGRADSSTLQE